MLKHAALLCELIQKAGHSRNYPLIGAEIGVKKAGTSAALLRTFPNLVLFMVDPWKEYPAVDGVRRVPQEAQDRRYAEAMANTDFAFDRRVVFRMPSVEAARLVGARMLDFVFVDGDHRENAAYDDCDFWYGKVTLGGLFCGHDYYREDKAGRRRPGFKTVKAAVDRFAAEIGKPVQLPGGTMWQIER
jgi:hypothetical protein